MSDETDSADERVHIRVMNEYGGGLPLWPDDPDIDPQDLVLSGGLRSDLMAFVARWDAAIDPEVTDDRWIGVPLMQQLVSAKYALDRVLHPARERAAAAEYEDMQRAGEALAVDVQAELGL